MAKAPSQPRLEAIRAGQAARRQARVVVIAARFNESITTALVDAACRTLVGHGVAAERIEVCWVPGTFELPVAAACAAAGRPDAIVAVGCLIKGETSQYAAIGQAVANGLAQVSVATGIPVGFGVIIADTIEQAEARAGGGAGNRGEEAALAALEMVDVVDRLTQARHASRLEQ